MAVADALRSLPTPSLILGERRMMRNIERLRLHLDAPGVPLRPHLKTAKPVEVARRVLAVRAGGCDLSVLVDSPEQAEAVAVASRRADDTIPVLIEIDSDGHRSGRLPRDPLAIAIGRILADGGAGLPDLPVGTRLRVLPNHACATAAQFDGYAWSTPRCFRCSRPPARPPPRWRSRGGRPT